MKLFKKAALLALAAILSVSVMAGCEKKEEGGGSSAGSAVSQKQTFTLGFDPEFPPMGYVDDSGKHVGFDLDLAAEVAKRNDWELKLQPIEWDAKDNELNSGTIDCIWNGFTKNDERRDEYAWTDAYMNNNQIVVVKADSSYKKIDDLKNKTIGVQRDSSALDAINGNAEFKKLYKTKIETTSNLSALQELDVGGVDAIVMDECVAIYNIDKKGAGYRILDNYVVGKEEFAVGFKLGNDSLRDKVQTTLLAMVQDGKMAEISNKWFQKDITTLGK